MSDITKFNAEKNALEFFAYVCLGGVHDRLSPEEIICRCGDTAYLDFCRTVNFKQNENKLPDDRRKSRAYINQEIFAVEIPKLIEEVTDEKNEDEKQVRFDKKHNDICESVCKYYNNILTYGQVQKWVNMTMKYMLLIETIKLSEFNISAVKKYIHIPIDNYILKAIKEYLLNEKDSTECTFGQETIFIIKKIDRITHHLIWKDKECAWSQITEYEMYDKFQRELRNELKDEIPSEWENRMWLETAKLI